LALKWQWQVHKIPMQRMGIPHLQLPGFLSVAKDLPAFLTDHVYSTAMYSVQQLCCKTAGEPLRYMTVMAVVSAILAVSSREEGSIKANPTSCQRQMSCIWLLQMSYSIWDSRVRATTREHTSKTAPLRASGISHDVRPETLGQLPIPNMHPCR
jgi:hypothetical protein